MSSIVLFQLVFNFIYNTFNKNKKIKKKSVLTKWTVSKQTLNGTFGLNKAKAKA